MSRSGYDDDCDNLNLYRAAVEKAIFGKRGQAFLRELLAAFDAMPVKELIEGELISADGHCCAIGAVCKARGIDVSRVDYEDPESVARIIGVATSMAAEIAFENDEGARFYINETPAVRWTRMRAWVLENLLEPK